MDFKKAAFVNVLLVQLGDIGDVVLTGPAIRAVKERYPGCDVSVLVRRPFGSIFAADPNLRDVVEVAKVRGTLSQKIRESLELIRRLRRSRYDLVVDLRTGDRGAILSFLSGARIRVGRHGIDKPFWHDLLFSTVIRDPSPAPPPVHPGADQSLRVLRAIGIDTADSAPRLVVSPKDRARILPLLEEAGLPPGAPFVTINPFSRWKYKEWGTKKWGEVIDRLRREHGLLSVLVGTRDEAVAANAVIAGRAGYGFSLAGKTSLGELAALLEMSTLHLGVDSSAPHIAAAVGTPTVTIFGPGNWKSWTIADSLHAVVTSDRVCLPCNRKGCDDSGSSLCIETLPVDAVAGAAGAILANIRSRVTARPGGDGRTARSGIDPSRDP